MQAFVRRKDLMDLYKSFDKIHDPSVYDIGPNDSEWVEVDTFQMNFSEQEAALTANSEALPKPPQQLKWRSPTLHNLDRLILKNKIAQNQALIRETIKATSSIIIPRTQAHNRKCAETTLEEEQEKRADIIAEQIKAWRSLLPSVLRKFSKIKDYRNQKKIKHKVTTLLMFGLFSFIFRLGSCREMNRELTSPVIFDNLKKIFPELETIPHADTLARLLKKMNPLEIEKANIQLIKDLIKKKKFKKLLIDGRLPITIDGTQKLFRDGLLNDGRWCERSVGKGNDKQQYIYIIEANITFKNGLTIPLMTEYLCRSNNQLDSSLDKQDNELTAFERLAERLKRYFPRLKIILLADSMYATQNVMDICKNNVWDFLITLPKDKLKELAKVLKEKEDTRQSIPEQTHYRERKQKFSWENNIIYGDSLSLIIHLVDCFESYDVVNTKTGEIEKKHSNHAWISSIAFSLNNLHELCNLGARKKELIEDSINTEKNRGYKYKHLFSHNWNAMKGFHYLMRLGHAINALSEFTKKLKKIIKGLGCSATLKLIKETLFNPWLSSKWYEEQLLEVPQLRLQSG